MKGTILRVGNTLILRVKNVWVDHINSEKAGWVIDYSLHHLAKGTSQVIRIISVRQVQLQVPKLEFLDYLEFITCSAIEMLVRTGLSNLIDSMIL